MRTLLPLLLLLIGLPAPAATAQKPAKKPSTDGFRHDTLAAQLDKVLAHRDGDLRTPLVALAARVKAVLTKPKERTALATRICEALEKRDASLAGRRFLCRQLHLIGGNESVPTLERLLFNQDMGSMAAYALQKIPGEKVTWILCRAVLKLEGAARIGAIHALGKRGDRTALRTLNNFTNDPDSAVRTAAYQALARIGDLSSAFFLFNRYEWSQKGAPTIGLSLIGCLETLVKTTPSEKKLAARMLDFIFRSGAPTQVRTAALSNLVRLRPEQATRDLLETLLKDNDRIAAMAIRLLDQGQGTKGLCDHLDHYMPRLAAHRSALLLGVLGRLGDPKARPWTLKALGHPLQSIRLAAVGALARLGRAADAAVLVPVLEGRGSLATTTEATLAAIPDPALDAQLVHLLSGAKATVQVRLMTVLTQRHSQGALPALVKLTGHAKSKVRKAAYRAAGKLARPAQLPELVALVIRSPARDQDAARRALAAACSRIPGADARTAPILAALAEAGAPARCTLLATLPLVGGAKALAAIRQARQAKEPTVRDAAVRALCAWPETEVLSELLTLARESKLQVHKVLALRGYARLAGKRSQRKAAETAKLFVDGLGAAERPEEKRLMLAGLGKVKCLPSLLTLEGYLTDKDLAADAASAIKRLGRDLDRWIGKDDKKRAREIVDKAKKFEETGK